MAEILKKMQYICKMRRFAKISTIKNGVRLRIPQKSFIDMNATHAHDPQAHPRTRSYLAHVHARPHAYAPARARAHTHTGAHTRTHTPAHTGAHAPAPARISKRIDTRKRFPIVSDIFYQQALTPVNASKNREFWGSYIKEGGSYIKEGPSCIKEQPSYVKGEIKKAGYYSSPAFPNKSAVMFDSVNIQKVQ